MPWGDLVSRIQLAHVAAAQGTYVVEKIAGMAHGTQLSVVPNGMFVVLPWFPTAFTQPGDRHRGHHGGHGTPSTT